jgi:MFS family permease
VPPATNAQHAGLLSLVSESRFWELTVSFALANLASVAISVHAIPYLTGQGVSASTAGVVLGAVGLMQLPGRLVVGPIRQRLAWQLATAIVFLTQGAAVVILAFRTSPPALAAFACLFGIGNGMSTLLRASVIADLYGAARYGRVSGVVSLVSTFARAGGPVLVSVVYSIAESYEWALGLLVASLGTAAALVVAPWALPERGAVALRRSAA